MPTGIVAFLLVFLLVAGICYFTLFYPQAKVKRIKKNLVLRVKGADARYSDLPLGDLGLFYEVKDRSRVRVVLPRLTPDGDVQYIYSWHNLKSISIPTLSNTKAQTAGNFGALLGLAHMIDEHIRFVEPEILSLRSQWQEINELLGLVTTSDLYASQQGIYERALVQVENLLDKAEELEQVYIRFIREALISRKLGNYDPGSLPSNSLMIDTKYQKIKEEYQYMKDMATAYAELRDMHRL
ncbi:hypothetical protein C1752_00808 [Acaryochloris thomasi RCC1774]|uniref:Uncharacterized protein n=1 Tax=Acaryochloris thomasi RCC1774 TaxID=1764569 RepID=A0A2W1JZ60_9CYAN|nr:hypothetical protein [Acaryochloris thomasi]PZD74734.1 hypothetical protein C1752_00808 [Acaryochloris thomasi RCC1774]